MSYERTNEVLLKADRINLIYGSNVVLRDLSVEIKHLKFVGDYLKGKVRQIICFLGPSGIGKTQLSRVISGLQKPTSGQVLLKGDKPVEKGSVCLVPQNYPMFEYTTVAKNLQIAGKMGGLTNDEINQKATGLIHRFDLGDHLSKYPKELSGGTKQRVAIARQMMCAGHYIVLDEPFSGLDPLMKRAAMNAILDLGSLDEYNVIIVITHDIVSGMAISDTVWLMGQEDGKAGAKIVKEYDLAALDLAWHPDIERDPKFIGLVQEVTGLFPTLKHT